MSRCRKQQYIERYTRGLRAAGWDCHYSVNTKQPGNTAAGEEVMRDPTTYYLEPWDGATGVPGPCDVQVHTTPTLQALQPPQGSLALGARH
jgi:hypothetical protein